MSQVSVIVPVYKVEQYLRRCVDSILCQTFSDFELILVDDGSPDDCPRICDEYAAADDRVRVIHKNNGGVSAARNAALDMSKGQYIAFCDSDDYWDNNWLEWLYGKMTVQNADMVSGGYQIVDELGQVVKQTSFSEKFSFLAEEKNISEYLISDILGYRAGWEIWTRLFKSSIIQKERIRFCETCENFAEDLGFVLEYLLYAKNVYTGDYTGYRYFTRSNSMMQCSRDVVKLNSMNEISKQFGMRLKQKHPTIYATHFPLIHFLLMHNQYTKLIGKPEYKKLPTELKKIRDTKWFNRQTHRILRCAKLLTERYGKSASQRMRLFSHLCLHKNWMIFCCESAIFYRFIYKGDD